MLFPRFLYFLQSSIIIILLNWAINHKYWIIHHHDDDNYLTSFSLVLVWLHFIHVYTFFSLQNLLVKEPLQPVAVSHSSWQLISVHLSVYALNMIISDSFVLIQYGLDWMIGNFETCKLAGDRNMRWHTIHQCVLKSQNIVNQRHNDWNSKIPLGGSPAFRIVIGAKCMHWYLLWIHQEARHNKGHIPWQSWDAYLPCHPIDFGQLHVSSFCAGDSCRGVSVRNPVLHALPVILHIIPCSSSYIPAHLP